MKPAASTVCHCCIFVSCQKLVAHFVCAKIADELKFFQAKSLKLVFPIEYPQDLIERFVCHSGSGDHPSLVDQAPLEILPEVLSPISRRCNARALAW